MKVSQAVEELLLATRADGRSERTVADYSQKLARLVLFLDDPDIAAVTTSDLRRFVASLRGQHRRYEDHPNRATLEGGLSAASVAGFVRAFKRLFSFLLLEGVISNNPAKAIKTPTLRRGDPKAISQGDFGRLLAATDGDDVSARRDRALLLVLADSACRVGGLVGLRLCDVDMERQTLYIQEKGAKGRYAFFSPVTRTALVRWLAVRPNDRGDRLFVSLGTRGKAHLTDQGVREVLRRLKARAGVKGPVNPHAFRHGFAREFIMAGGDLGSLADIMGHSDVRVTWASYAVFTVEELKRKHAAYSPVAQLERAGML